MGKGESHRSLSRSTPTPTAPGILVVSRGGHPGVDDALHQLTSNGQLRSAEHVKIHDVRSSESASAFQRIIDLVQRARIEIVVLHHYHGAGVPDPRHTVTAIQKQPHRPVVAVTCGDAFFNGFPFRPALPEVLRHASSVADITFSTSMGPLAEAFVAAGARRVTLWPNGACQVRFARSRAPASTGGEVYDVAFIGSNNKPRDPRHGYFWFARERNRLVGDLTARFGSRFAVFGHGWEGVSSNRGPISYQDQLRVCQQARVVVGGVPFSRGRYYTSDRVFNQALSGVPFVDISLDGLEALLRAGEHWHLVEHHKEVADRCAELLALPKRDRTELGSRAADHVAQHHMQFHRWTSLVSTMRGLHEALRDDIEPAPPDLSFLLPEVDRTEEIPLATRGYADPLGSTRADCW